MFDRIETFLEKFPVSWQGWIFGLGIAIVSWITLSLFHWSREVYSLRKIISRKQKEREAQFRRLESEYELTEDKIAIVNKPPEELLDLLQKRKLTSVSVLDAFISKALIIQRKNNCITEFILEAKKWAKELDEMKQVKGPLHGLPISIKDNIFVEGYDCTIGLGKNLYKPKNKSASLVLQLQDLGAIPFCKTNIPQTLLSYSCSNPIFGETTNYHNQKLSPGGSSGGEATLVAGGGSLLGICSDIGGSIRIPAHFSGLSGLKPTSFRLSPVGFQASIPNVVGIHGCPGFVSKDLFLIKKVFQLLTHEDLQTKYDKQTLPIPWNEKLYSNSSNRKLRIGYFTEMDFFPLMGDTEKILLKAKSRLESDGHTLIPFEMPDSYRMTELFVEFSVGDAGSGFLKNWKYEPIPQSVLYNFLVLNLPRWVRKFVAKLMTFKWMPLISSRRGPIFLRCGETSTARVWNLLGEKKDMISELVSRWTDQKLDLLLMPSFPFPAVPLKVPAAFVYTMVWNLFDFPCGVVRFGEESGELIKNIDHQGDFLLKPAARGILESKGMPITVQLVGLPHNDEVVIKGMEILERLAS